ncbi:MAG: hypothetical protein Q7S44_03630 [bacterium]|nr:hypothetical protein [bacterium]
MLKRFIETISLLFASLFITQLAYAANLSLRVEQPKTPTNQSSFNITFVALDLQNNPITVKCYKKGPSDSDFTQFGSDINLIAGGDTDSCQVDSSILSAEGSYIFQVKATDGSEDAQKEVTVEYKTSGPDTPVSYSKEQTACQYKIKFKTADDGGKTSKVEVYRSENTNFTADGSTRVATVWIGSNQEGSSLVDGECGKTYYFAIRAFDGAGNGSGIIGDSETKIVTTTVVNTTPTPGAGAIPISESSLSQGEILGEEATKSSEGKTLGENASDSGQDIPQGSPSNGRRSLFSLNNILIALGILLILGAFYRYQKSRK